MFLPVTQRGLVAVTPAGEPAWLTAAPTAAEGATGLRVKVGADLWAAEVADDAPLAAGAVHPVAIAHAPFVARAVALLRNRQIHRYHPTTGEKLGYTEGNIVGRTPEGREVFPRLDPAVIGVVTHGQPGSPEETLLLGRNARRNSFYSLPAGYVDVGETLEEAFAREILEETGRRVRDMRYWGSQPWPASGSLMVGFWGATDDVHPVSHTDEELEEVRWFTRAELAELDSAQLARRGAIAHRMIMEWLHGGA
ncbi:NUDIX domain-containing protein [uncultured Corynebacterium sp.]|uniref:NAD(+) diphosphatase n=1 Tax=uncultured Corynebacterium sp. TaxID=159447 RepID=UPI0025FC34A0|nr:NUDIX domain-containing protein [uncultured Corynebacterium sp.]